MSTARRELLVRFCAALWGLAIAMALLPFWERPAPPTQPPGYMTSLGIDAHASFRFTLACALEALRLAAIGAVKAARDLLRR